MWQAGLWAGSAVLRKEAEPVDSLWASSGPPRLLAGGRASPGFVPGVSDVFICTGGRSLSEWRVWGEVPTIRSSPGEVQHGSDPPGLKLLWHVPAG